MNFSGLGVGIAHMIFSTGVWNSTFFSERIMMVIIQEDVNSNTSHYMPLYASCTLYTFSTTIPGKNNL
jgi:hypothetical protein